MKAATRFFGEIEYSEGDVVTFRNGLYGFEDETRFLLLPFEENEMFYALQSLATPELCFLLAHPFSLDAGYAPVLQAEELKALEAKRSEDLCYYVMCAVKKPVSESTVNMKCPVALNPDTREAMQVILEEGPWGMRHLLSEYEGKKGGSAC